MKHITLKHLILCGNLAVLGMLAKPLFSPMFNLLTDFIHIPGGSVTAGISILFLVFGSILIRRPGTAALMGFLQAVISLSSGISAAAGALVLITYTLPGVMTDLVICSPLPVSMKTKAELAGALGVLAGASSTNLLYFHLSLIPFLLFYIFGILSGALGGYLAWVIYCRLPEQYKKGFSTYEKEN
ncbi:MAG: ECF transporter S component [Solobacterium sp.]|nr:ECF transporter S component [Solobacterium sp.]